MADSGLECITETAGSLCQWCSSALGDIVTDRTGVSPIAGGTVRIGPAPLPIGGMGLGRGVTIGTGAGRCSTAAGQRHAIKGRSPGCAMAGLADKQVLLGLAAVKARRNGGGGSERNLVEVAQGVVETARNGQRGRSGGLDRRICAGSMADGAGAGVGRVGSDVGRSGDGEPWFSRMRSINAAAVTSSIVKTGHRRTVNE